MRLEQWIWFEPSSKIFYWPFQGGTSFVDLLYFFSVLCLLCLCVSLFICALWSHAGKGLTSWLSFVLSYCEFVTFPLVSCARCGTWLYWFLIFAPLLTLKIIFSIQGLHITGTKFENAVMLPLTHISLSEHPFVEHQQTVKKHIRRCKSVWPGSPLFVYRSFFQNLNKIENHHPTTLKLDRDWKIHLAWMS